MSADVEHADEERELDLGDLVEQILQGMLSPEQLREIDPAKLPADLADTIFRKGARASDPEVTAKLTEYLQSQQGEVARIILRGHKPIRRESPVVNRNAPCPCGSGRKFKKCCMGKPPQKKE